jgi:hypothetical protein
MNYNCWQFMGDHPMVTLVIAYFICKMIVDVVRRICKTIKDKRDEQ